MQNLSKTYSVALHNFSTKQKESASQVLSQAGFSVCNLPSKLVKPSGKVLIVSGEPTKLFDQHIVVSTKWLDAVAQGVIFHSEEQLREYGFIFLDAP